MRLHWLTMGTSVEEGRRLRIGVGSIQHESCGMVNREVTKADFDAAGIDSAAALALGDANTAADGVVRSVREAGADPVPLLFTEPKTAGQPTVATLSAVIAEVVDAIAAASPLDGVALALHGGFSAHVPEEGAAVAFGDDADGDLLAAVRAQVGPGVPIAASMDLHSNLSERGVAAADALCIIRTYPHVDDAARGAQAAALVAAMARGEVRPTTAWRPLPLLWSAGCMIDAQAPMAAIRQRVDELEQAPGSSPPACMPATSGWTTPPSAPAWWLPLTATPRQPPTRPSALRGGCGSSGSSFCSRRFPRRRRSSRRTP